MGEGSCSVCVGVGDVYVGEWRRDLRCGYGEMKFNNGSLYKGNWYNDNIHGKGTY